jgi:integrase
VAVANQLRAHLRNTFPGAVGLFAEIDSPISLAFLTRFDTQDRADWLSPKRLGAWLSSVGYCGRVEPAVLHTRLTADALRPVIEHYGHLPLQSLDVPHLEKLKRGMLSGELRRIGRKGEPLSPRTTNYMLTAVTSALRAAQRRRLVAFNVGEAVDRVESDPDAGADRSGWELEHVRRFLGHVRGHRLYGAFLLTCCGLRRGEVLGLRWSSVVLTGDSPTLSVTWNRVQVGNDLHEHSPKSRASRRTLPLPAPVVAALDGLLLAQREEAEQAAEAYRPDCPLCGGVHVVADELGRPYRPEWFSDEFDRQARAAGLPRVPLHGARHAAASLLGAMGVPILHVASWSGQSQISVTAGYQHAGAAGLADVAQRFADVLAEDVTKP